MNKPLRDFEDAIDKALTEADGNLEIAEVVGVMQLKLWIICARVQTRTMEQDPADSWKNLKDE